MPGLSEIEKKIAALRQRYAELDEKLVPKRNGVVDMAVSTAMGAVTTEIARLERLREKALVCDLIGEKAEEPKQPPSSPPRLAPLQMPVFATDKADISDPILDLDRLPSAEGERTELFRKLVGFAIRKVNSSLQASQQAVNQDIPVAFTQGFFRALITTLGVLHAEHRLLVAMGRDHRKDLEETLLKRIEALEARPVMIDAGVFDDAKTYSPGSFVSYQGSGWAAQVKTKGVRPGDGTIWRLAVKKGRDGKDATR